MPVQHVPLGFVSAATKDRLHQHTKHSSYNNKSTPHPPLGKLSKLVVPSFNTPLHTSCPPPSALSKESSSLGRA